VSKIYTELSIPAYTETEVTTLLGAKVDLVYLGEPYCYKRANYLWTEDNYKKAVSRLLKAGKKVALSTLADATIPISAQINDRILRIALEFGLPIVANDLALYYLAAKGSTRPSLIAGFFVPVYNELDIDQHINFGSQRIQIPQDMHRSEIESMASKRDIPLEMQIHGPICLSLSWKCYLMELLPKGAEECFVECPDCDQLYTLFALDKKTPLFNLGGKMLMSARDMCLIVQLPEILERIRPQVLFIETRTRGADYGKKVASIYRKALNDISINKHHKETDWVQKLRELSPSGQLCNGYFLSSVAGRMYEGG